MFSNYFKIALRSILKHKAHSFINIMGLAVGLTCVVLILLFVQDELSYDTFNTKADRIYRVTREWLNEDGATSLHLARVAPPIGTLLQHEYPSTIDDMVRLLDAGTVSFTYGQKQFVEDRIYFAEPSFFNIFSFRMIEGDPKTALSQPMSAVLTQSTARKYFGDQPALGKSILYDGKQAVKVTGVMQDVPHTAHFHFDMLIFLAQGNLQAVPYTMLFHIPTVPGWQGIPLHLQALVKPPACNLFISTSASFVLK